MKRLTLSLVLVLAACGPAETVGNGDGDGDSDGSGIDGGTAPIPEEGTIHGTVWAPGNAPGMVPEGHEIPVFGAVVYLSYTRPAPIPQQTHCDQCVDPPGRAVFTDHAGRFTIPSAEPNDYWLIIQKGQWRIEQPITVPADRGINLPAEATTLPSEHDPERGLWVPRIALATGIHDQIEDIIGKMGIGEVYQDTGRFVAESAAGNFDVYGNGGYINDVALAPLQDLFKITSAPGVEPIEGPMMKYHIIFIPCASQTYPAGPDENLGLEGAPVETLEAIRAFVSAGGKLYVTDWSGEWSDNIFPEQVQFSSDHDTPAEAWDPETETWDPSKFNDADGAPSYQSKHARAVDQDLNQWISLQQGPIVLDGYAGYDEGAYDGDEFIIEGNWDTIESLHDVEVGLTEEGFPVVDSPYTYIIGDKNGSPASCTGEGSGCHPLTVTFEPTGCGRVLYSSYHTADGQHTGLVPQERVLLYLIMEIGLCKSGPIID